LQAYTQVATIDDRKDYYISRLPYYLDADGNHVKSKVEVRTGEFGHVKFQDEVDDINGCDEEDVVAIVLDRLRYFQWGKGSKKKQLAITKLEEVMHILHEVRYGGNKCYRVPTLKGKS